MKWVCEQRGCGEFAVDCFDDGDDEHLCPVCGHPLFERDGEVAQNGGAEALGELPWSAYSRADLIDYAKSWHIGGWQEMKTDAELIKGLEAAEAE